MATRNRRSSGVGTAQRARPAPGTLRGSGRRFGWGIADQLLSSLTNFVLGLLVARKLGPHDFGAFSLAFASYTLALGASRALASEPLTVRYSASTVAEWRRGARSASGLAVLAGAALGVAALIAGVLAAEPTRTAFLMLSITLPGLLLQDSWRFAFFAGQRERQAFLNDLVWALFLFPAVAVLMWADRTSVAWLMLAWGGAASVAALVGVIQARVVPAPGRAPIWLREQRDLAPRFLGEFGVTTGVSQLTLFGVGALAGLSDVAALRAGLIVLGPLNVLFMAAGLFAVPEGVRLLASSPALFRRAAFLLSALLAAGALTWGMMALLLPTSIGTALLGDNWAGARRILLPLTIAGTTAAASTGAIVGLRAMAAAKRSLRARVVAAILTLASGVVGASIAGAVGVAWGYASAGWMATFVWWSHFLRVAKKYRRRRSLRPSDGGASDRTKRLTTLAPGQR